MRVTPVRFVMGVRLGAVLLLLSALILPTVSQPAAYHAFADSRPFWGMPNAADVLSNVAFAAVGLCGVLGLLTRSAQGIHRLERQMCWLFLAGLFLTSVLSGYYHLRPDDHRLLLDRIGMAVAFVGVLGLLAAGKLQEHAARELAAWAALVAITTLAATVVQKNALPWLLFQVCGLLLIASLWRRSSVDAALEVKWAWVGAGYAVAKVFELADVQIFEATRQFVSGHTLKHLVAAIATWPVIHAVLAVARRRMP